MGAQSKLDRLKTLWARHIKTPGQFTYSTESCQEAKIDSDTLIREFKLLSETRKICENVTSMEAKDTCGVSFKMQTVSIHWHLCIQTRSFPSSLLARLGGAGELPRRLDVPGPRHPGLQVEGAPLHAECASDVDCHHHCR